MKINEIFDSIQGEGAFAGHPALFIRVCGCTRACSFCDTKYHIEGFEMSIKKIVKRIKAAGINIVVWTGGEPALHADDIYDVIEQTKDFEHHLESNGDLLMDYNMFDYVCISPKVLNVAKNMFSFLDMLPEENKTKFDIKVVTDLELNKDFIEYATMLMPLTVDNDGPMDKATEQAVWKYCASHDKIFCLRQHVKVWGSKKGV